MQVSQSFFVLLRRYTAIWKQLLFANDKSGAVLGLSQDGAGTDLFENSLKGDLSNVTTFKPPLFSMVNTFKLIKMFFLLIYSSII
jgi:hypothetical protein